MGNKIVDHMDMNTLNNQKNNLRPCTNSQNGANRKSFNNSSSKYKGVTIRIGAKGIKWISQINVNGEVKHLGVFLDEKNAAIKYDEAAKIHFRDFARLNFP